jgi:glycosyltransferase involved in cell wall biosynthesis
MSAPLLTVLMPVYNAARHLEDAIASVLAQSFEDFELLLVDDGSTDESTEVVRGFRDKRIRIETQAKNVGLIETLNSGIGMARGSLLARMDADDLSHPERFALQVDYLCAHPEVAGVSCAFDVIDDRGRPLPDDYGRARPVEPLALRWGLNFGCFFTHSGAVLRSSVLRESGGFDSRYAHAEDYELWLRLVDEYRLANIARVLLTVRKHGANVSSRFREIQRQNAYLALEASLERLLKRKIVSQHVCHLRDGTLAEAAGEVWAVAALHCEVFDSLTRAESQDEARPIAGDLAQRLGVLASRALRPHPMIALRIAASGMKYDFENFVVGFLANRHGDPRVYRRSPIFTQAGLAHSGGWEVDPQ